jgi:putative ABC transport system permease protein
MNSILTAVFFTILLVTGNTMSQAVRERTSEIAVLKAIGYRDMMIMTLVLFEAIAICVVGAILGLLLTAALLPSIQVGLYAFFGDFGFKPSILFTGLGLALCTALLSGFPPAIAAMRLKVVDALRKE